MHPNPMLRQLGLADTDRVAIIHADDIGMCQATLDAFADLDAFGLVSCAALMVPCPWFPAAAAYARTHPRADFGVHLTLNCEYTSYRWGALSTCDPASGLLDDDGYLHRRPEQTQARGEPAAVRAELRRQVQRALAAGVAVSHIDTHMGTVAHRKFVSAYVELALEFRLPVMLMRYDEAGWRRAWDMDAETAAQAAAAVQELEAAGVALVDHIAGMRLDAPDDRLAQARAALGALQPGITHFIIHPAADTPELRAITPADWPSRVGDYRTFMSEELARFVRDSGIHVIGYRALRYLMR